MCADRNRDPVPSTQEIVDAIVAAYQTIESAFFDALHRSLPDITSAEFNVLEVLSAHRFQRASAISDALSLAPSTLTRYCDHLAELGLVTRDREPQDRREILIELTRKGRNAVKEILAFQQEDIAERLTTIPSADRRTLERALHRIVDPPELRRHSAEGLGA